MGRTLTGYGDQDRGCQLIGRSRDHFSEAGCEFTIADLGRLRKQARMKR